MRARFTLTALAVAAALVGGCGPAPASVAELPFAKDPPSTASKAASKDLALATPPPGELPLDFAYDVRPHLKRIAVAAALRRLHDDVPGATATAVAAQYAGLLDRQASVMVEVHMGSGTKSSLTEVQLTRATTGWAVTHIRVHDGGCRQPVRLSAAATEVLTSPRIGLSGPARRDVHCGEVDEDLLRILAGVADRATMRVLTFRTGHPAHVFGTAQLSHHTRGRAVDIPLIGGRPVSDPKAARDVRAVVDAARSLGATEIGAPFDVDGPGGAVFANDLHHDHVHLGLDS